jgi:hypothetical protein
MAPTPTATQLKHVTQLKPFDATTPPLNLKSVDVYLHYPSFVIEILGDFGLVAGSRLIVRTRSPAPQWTVQGSG